MVRNTNVHIRLEGNCSTQNGEFIEIILVRSVSLNQVGCVQSEDIIFSSTMKNDKVKPTYSKRVWILVSQLKWGKINGQGLHPAL